MSHIVRKLLKNLFLPFDFIFTTMMCQIVAPLRRRPAYRDQLPIPSDHVTTHGHWRIFYFNACLPHVLRGPSPKPLLTPTFPIFGHLRRLSICHRPSPSGKANGGSSNRRSRRPIVFLCITCGAFGQWSETGRGILSLLLTS